MDAASSGRTDRWGPAAPPRRQPFEYAWKRRSLAGAPRSDSCSLANSALDMATTSRNTWPRLRLGLPAIRPVTMAPRLWLRRAWYRWFSVTALVVRAEASHKA